jgi:hypothetical protein
MLWPPSGLAETLTSTSAEVDAAEERCADGCPFLAAAAATATAAAGGRGGPLALLRSASASCIAIAISALRSGALMTSYFWKPAGATHSTNQNSAVESHILQ